jgi:predicted Zn-dependent protease
MNSPMKTLFHHASDLLIHALLPGEGLTINIEAEESLFIRFSKSKIRQIVDVTQVNLFLSLLIGSKTAQLSIQIPFTTETASLDVELLDKLKSLREEVQQLPDDPFARPLENNGESTDDYSDTILPNADIYCRELLAPVTEVDLAGILVSGTSYAGNRNSCGQSHWFVSRSFYFDYSLYTEREKAVKGLYADTLFNAGRYRSKIAESLNYLEQMVKPNKILQPGPYRCYFAPAAVAELFDLMGWNGFSRGALARGDSPMTDLSNGEKSLSPLLSVAEDFSLGLVPSFNELGEPAPGHLPLIRNGKLTTLLCSSRTAKEYDETSNQASWQESPRSLVIEPGQLAEKDILKELGTGLYISNLHYLNWSDINKGRVTGMTRFACFWVENGEIVCPIKDMRFDDSFYNFLGEGLLALTGFTETQPSLSSYDRRELGGVRVPGMLIKDFFFSL